MAAVDPKAACRFAVEVVRQLREAGYESLWAGGCVRDRALGREPKDYDVATDATPDEIREVFGRRRTLPIGAAFGVVTVLGSKSEGQIEVATFRQDAQYSDGRHPDSVTFSSAEEDAQRRDFTINGLFYDPLHDRVIDYVGGQEDLKQRVVRAIGDPSQRIAEDKLRMLRAVRFTTTMGFGLDPATLSAIRRQAAEISVVSAERVTAELRRMLTHPRRAAAVQLLRESRLLEVILPEVSALYACDETWQRTIAVLERLEDVTFAVAISPLLREICRSGPEIADKQVRYCCATICRRWKMSNEEIATTNWLLANEPLIRSATSVAWPRLQRVLVADRVDELLQFCSAVAEVVDSGLAHVDFCRRKLALPREEFDPAPLIDGEDLRAAGIKPGPAYSKLLVAVRDAQLEGTITTKDAALALAVSLVSQ